MDQQFIGSPAISIVITQNAGHRHVLGHAEEIILDVVHFENAAISPEVLGIVKQVAFMFGNDDGNSLDDRASVSLALVAMVMGMKDCINLADANLSQQIQNVPGPEINQDCMVSVLEDIHVAGVAQDVKVGRDLR